MNTTSQTEPSPAQRRAQAINALDRAFIKAREKQNAVLIFDDEELIIIGIDNWYQYAQKHAKGSISPIHSSGGITICQTHADISTWSAVDFELYLGDIQEIVLKEAGIETEGLDLPIYHEPPR